MADITIPVFDGEDYGNWKQRITMYLKLKKCYTVTTRMKIDSDKHTWDDDNLKAINYIYGAISNKQLEFVNDKETAFEIMKKFDELYSKESTALQIVCRNKLDKLRLTEYSDTSTFFNIFEKTVNELKSAGAKVTEKEKLNYMLRTLPESLSYIGDLIDVLTEEEQTVEYVKSKIRLMDVKDTDRSEGAKSNVFHTEWKLSSNNKQQVCYGCGKPGHIKRDCRQTGTNNRDTWKRGGHFQTQSRGYGVQRGGYSSNLRGRAAQHRVKSGRYQGGRGYQQSEPGMNRFVT